ncbi:DMT family transporter [Patescibacteria group bacterium]
MKKYISIAGPVFIIIAAILWSTDTVFRFPLTEQISATMIVFAEHALGALILLPLIWKAVKLLKRLSVKEWGAFLFITIGGSVIATLAFTASFSHVSPSVAILLQKTQPLIAIMLATIFLHEKMPKNFWWWAFLAIGGAYLVSFPDILPNLSIYEGGAIGIFYALIAAFFWGGSTVFGRIVLKRISYYQLTALRLGGGAVALFAILLWQGNTNLIGQLTSDQFIKLLLIVLIPGTFALLIYYRGLAKTKASVATIAELTWPLSAVIINWIILEQSLVPMQLIGGAVLLLAIARVTILNQRIKDKYSNENQPS